LLYYQASFLAPRMEIVCLAFVFSKLFRLTECCLDYLHEGSHLISCVDALLRLALYQ
jgi:hypothetical protein